MAADVEARIAADIAQISKVMETAYRISYAAANLPEEEASLALEAFPITDQRLTVYTEVIELERRIKQYRRKAHKRVNA